jgi:hypothetical protein
MYMKNNRIQLFQPQALGQTINAFLLAAICGALLFTIITQPIDEDTWWHLRAGEVTYLQGRPLTIDVFSYTRFGEPWPAHGWLTELWLYVVYQAAGFTGITIWMVLLSIAICTLAYYQMEGPPVYRAILLLIICVLLLPVLTQPQMISLVFFLLTYWIIRNYLNKKRDLIVWLIPSFILWANFQEGFLAGFILILLVIVGDKTGKTVNQADTQYVNSKRIVRLLVVVMLCAIAVMIHPLGINVWNAVYNSMSMSGEGATFVEWASLNFNNPVQQLYMLFLLINLIIITFTAQKMPVFELLLFSAFTVMGYIWIRNLAFVVVYGMVISSGYLWKTIDERVKNRNSSLTRKIGARIGGINKRMPQKSPVGIQILFMILIAIVFAGAELKMYLITDQTTMAKWENRSFPIGAKNWIQENKPEGKMMNSYDWGGYFDWYLREYPVFLDNRADLFGNEIIHQWLDVMNAKDGWQAILDRWNVNLIVIEPGWKIADLLPYYGWTEYYQDEQAVIYGRSVNTGGQE